MEEPRYGGLIDKWWIIHIGSFVEAAISIFFVLYVIGRSCPYVEDVSSCFPWSLPNWVKIAIPLVILALIPILCLIIVKLNKGKIINKWL